MSLRLCVFCLRPQYAYACVRTPLLWSGLAYTMNKVAQSYANPTMRDIYSFLQTLFVRAHLSSECSIVSLIYARIGRAQKALFFDQTRMMQKTLRSRARVRMFARNRWSG